MKSYEIFSQLKTIPDIPVILRLDGRSFSKYTKQLKLAKPFDKRLRDIFIEVSKDVLCEFNAKYVYTFSDEISILFEQQPFNGRIEKLDSVVASFVTASFMKHLYQSKDLFDIDMTNMEIPSFDCRIVMTNNLKQYFKWRQDEAWRNCINGYAQSMLNKTHNSRETSQILYGLNKSQIHELLYENGVNISHVPTWQKRGIAVYKKEYQKENINPENNKKNISTYKKVYVDMQINLIRE